MFVGRGGSKKFKKKFGPKIIQVKPPKKPRVRNAHPGGGFPTLKGEKTPLGHSGFLVSQPIPSSRTLYPNFMDVPIFIYRQVFMSRLICHQKKKQQILQFHWSLPRVSVSFELPSLTFRRPEGDRRKNLTRKRKEQGRKTAGGVRLADSEINVAQAQFTQN